MNENGFNQNNQVGNSYNNGNSQSPSYQMPQGQVEQQFVSQNQPQPMVQNNQPQSMQSQMVSPQNIGQNLNQVNVQNVPISGLNNGVIQNYNNQPQVNNPMQYMDVNENGIPNNPFSNINQFNYQVNEINPNIVNNNGGNDGQKPNNKPYVAKSVTGGLLVVMLLIFAALSYAINYYTNDEKILMCDYSDSTNGILFEVKYEYYFKNNHLTKEKIDYITNLGSYYYQSADEYSKELKKQYVEFIDAGYDYEIIKEKPYVELILEGSGKTMIKYHDFSSFANAPGYLEVKELAEGNNFTCRLE